MGVILYFWGILAGQRHGQVVGLERGRLQAMLLLELQILLPEGVDTINHNLDQLDLGVAKTVLVGDVISVAYGETRSINSLYIYKKE